MPSKDLFESALPAALFGIGFAPVNSVQIAFCEFELLIAFVGAGFQLNQESLEAASILGRIFLQAQGSIFLVVEFDHSRTDAEARLHRLVEAECLAKSLDSFRERGQFRLKAGQTRRDLSPGENNCDRDQEWTSNENNLKGTLHQESLNFQHLGGRLNFEKGIDLLWRKSVDLAPVE